MKKEALISECSTFRYYLFRGWDDENDRRVCFLMLNPSTADAWNDDPTIVRCINFARSWGYGGMYVVNLFPHRSTDPKALLTTSFGDEVDRNMKYIAMLVSLSDKVILAYGNEPILKAIRPKVSDYFDRLSLFFCDHFVRNKAHAIELSNNGIPKHPLYLKKDLEPIKIDKLPL